MSPEERAVHSSKCCESVQGAGGGGPRARQQNLGDSRACPMERQALGVQVPGEAERREDRKAQISSVRMNHRGAPMSQKFQQAAGTAARELMPELWC